jgi:hypothetical protein
MMLKYHRPDLIGPDDEAQPDLPDLPRSPFATATSSSLFSTSSSSSSSSAFGRNGNNNTNNRWQCRGCDRANPQSQQVCVSCRSPRVSC